MKELLEEASRSGKAVGGFNVGNMEMVAGAVQAAEKTETPVILQIAEKRLQASPLNLMAPMMVQAAKDAKVKVAVHLDHGLTFEVIKQALDFGFSSVMFDGSEYSLEENIRRTKEVKELAARYGASLEAELGAVGGNEGNGDKAVSYTNPDDAELFFNAVGMDALAVAIGNAHGHYTSVPQLRFDVLEEIHQRIRVPLVLHGGSGISFEEFRKTIGHGIRKINIATASFDAMTEADREYLEKNPDGNYFGLSSSGIRGVYENVMKHIHVFNNEKPLKEL
ncbi:MAG: ketose-bisphosphate aldolase [Clostridiaceae bacterium]|nr:ketose-bisphosphate aldolase [Clostridiaceae bacterium]